VFARPSGMADNRLAVVAVTAPDAVQRGREARQSVTRRGHAGWSPPAGRADPVDVLVEQGRHRVPQLLAIRYGRMLRSPFAFFRGAAAIMAADLATLPATGIHAQLCGDAHLGNFGAYAAPDRGLVFDCNDFDETLRGPWEWDVKRMAASAAVLGRERGLPAAERTDIVAAAVRAYRKAMAGFADMRALDVWYARQDVEPLMARWSRHLARDRRKDLNKTVAKARRKDSLRALRKLTYNMDGEPRIVSDPPLVLPLAELVEPGRQAEVREHVVGAVDEYQATLAPDRRHALSAYRPVDVAHKVVGVGSVGNRAWIVLMLGRGTDDPLFLQVKEAGPSVLEPFVAGDHDAVHGRRVVEGQRLMQGATDAFLGWVRFERDLDGARRDYYVRQLWDAKGAIALDTLDADELRRYAETCAWTLARAHARSGDGLAIAGYLGHGDRFDRAIADFAEAYADQNARDHAALAAAVEAGRLEADRTR
jgi:uncharacterized protein (DUF2252 family)